MFKFIFKKIIFFLAKFLESDSIFFIGGDKKKDCQQPKKRRKKMAKDWKKEVAYQLSTEGLKAHIASLDKPDSLFWDCRQLKKEGKKFQNLDWSVFPHVTKNEEGDWIFKK